MIKPKIVKDFQYKGRRCVVVLINNSETRKIIPDSFFNADYHNGYIEIKDNEIKKNENYDVNEEITYSGDLKHIEEPTDKFYIGFDTAHSYNFDNPITQTAEYVENKCKEIVDELESVKENEI